MTDFTWYSRLLVWVGALVLLVDSVSGRGLGFITVLAVIALAGGLVGFVGGLAIDGGAVEALAGPLAQYLAGGETVPDHVVAPPTPRVAVTSISREAAIPVVQEPAPVAPLTSPPKPFEAPLLGSRVSADGAVTTELDDRNVLVGQPCQVCHEPLRSGQVAAECAQCGARHHAACWVSSHFHCARDGCGGHGGLRAPDPENT